MTYAPALNCIKYSVGIDPCCGSGGMFIQSAALVKSKQGAINRINVYGQEKEPATYRLAKMNLALRGIRHSLGDSSDSSFLKDLHKSVYFNYIMANPPYNLKGWYDSTLEHDPRWADYQTPPESNANYAWILHMLSHLKKQTGVAGFLLANGVFNDSDTIEIRKNLIQNDKVEAIIVLPRELFITTDISVTLWILNQNKKDGCSLRLYILTSQIKFRHSLRTFFSVRCAFFSVIYHLFINNFCCSVAKIIHFLHPQHHIFSLKFFCNLLLLGK